MSATGLDVFDRTLQAANIWLDDVMRETGWRDRQKAYHALRAVLHTLRDNLPVNDAAHFSAQLPMLVRGLFYEGWRPAKVPVRERSRAMFLRHITDAFLFDISADAQHITSAVLRTVSRHVSPGVVQHIRGLMTADVREVWPVDATVAVRV